MNLDFYYFPSSHWSRAVHLALREKRLEPRYHVVDIRIAEQYEPDYIDLNPRGVVPTLVHDGEVVTDSLRIARYLDGVAEPDLHPDGDVANWVERLEAFPLMHLSYFVWTQGKRGEKSQEILDDKVARGAAYAERHPEQAERYERKRIYFERFRALLNDPEFHTNTMAACQNDLEDLAHRVAQQPWVGPTYSFADCIATSILYRLIDLKLLDEWNREGTSLHAYFQRLRARPNYAPVFEQDPRLEVVRSGMPPRKPLDG